ncbi:MAG: hypothetical protein OXG15_00045 [Gammaproteobacteria bacterium]|nr:hypothetical protein [Gammaproteobacteria bacterium]
MSEAVYKIEVWFDSIQITVNGKSVAGYDYDADLDAWTHQLGTLFTFPARTQTMSSRMQVLDEVWRWAEEHIEQLMAVRDGRN